MIHLTDPSFGYTTPAVDRVVLTLQTGKDDVPHQPVRPDFCPNTLIRGMLCIVTLNPG